MEAILEAGKEEGAAEEIEEDEARGEVDDKVQEMVAEDVEAPGGVIEGEGEVEEGAASGGVVVDREEGAEEGGDRLVVFNRRGVVEDEGAAEAVRVGEASREDEEKGGEEGRVAEPVERSGSLKMHGRLWRKETRIPPHRPAKSQFLVRFSITKMDWNKL